MTPFILNVYHLQKSADIRYINDFLELGIERYCRVSFPPGPTWLT